MKTIFGTCVECGQKRLLFPFACIQCLPEPHLETEVKPENPSIKDTMKEG